MFYFIRKDGVKWLGRIGKCEPCKSVKYSNVNFFKGYITKEKDSRSLTVTEL